MKNLALAILLLSPFAEAYQPKLVWDPYTDPAATHFRIYWQQAPGAAFTVMSEPPISATIAQIPSLPENVQHCFYMTAANADIESEPSNTVCYTALPWLELGPMGLDIHGEPGRTYRVYQSPDFVTWTPVQTITMPSLDHKVRIPVDFSEPKMFFKVIGD